MSFCDTPDLVPLIADFGPLYSWIALFGVASELCQFAVFGVSVPIAQRACVGAYVIASPLDPVTTRPATSVLPELASVPFVCSAMCRSGRYAEGESNSRKAFESSTKAFGPRAGLTGGVASTLASCLIDLGKLDEASKLLEQIDVQATSQLAGDPDWGAGVTLLHAEIAYRRKGLPNGAEGCTVGDARLYT